MMNINWTEHLITTGLEPRMFTGANGDVLLSFSRVAMDAALPNSTYLVAEADGAVKNAVLLPWPYPNDPGCVIVPEGIGDGKFIWNVYGDDWDGDWSTSEHEGAIGGDIGAITPQALVHKADDRSYDFSVSGAWLGASNTYEEITLSPWPDTSQELIIASAVTDPENQSLGALVLSGEAAFWESGDLVRIGINVWDQANGARPFIRFLGDTTRGAGNFGTDGVDMVWSYGEGKMPGDMNFPIRSIMTAPFTTDPAAVQPTRLRSQPSNGISEEIWKVGCGYGTHKWLNQPMVIRLADGVSWQLPEDLGTLDLFPNALGVTCEEVFAVGLVDGRVTILRFEIDSLGPGMLPD